MKIVTEIFLYMNSESLYELINERSKYKINFIWKILIMVINSVATFVRAV